MVEAIFSNVLSEMWSGHCTELERPMVAVGSVLLLVYVFEIQMAFYTRKKHVKQLW